MASFSKLIDRAFLAFPDRDGKHRVARAEPATNCVTPWRQYVRGWWGYYRLAENRRPIFKLEGWIRRHIRSCFWLRWHKPVGRERKLRRLGLRGRMLQVAQSRMSLLGMVHYL